MLKKTLSVLIFLFILFSCELINNPFLEDSFFLKNNTDSTTTTTDTTTDITSTTTTTVSNLSNNSDLSSLVLSNGIILTPVFSAKDLNYTANVQNELNLVTITPTKAHANSNIKLFAKFDGITDVSSDIQSGSQSSPITLNVGDNIITLIVTAEDGISTATYTLTINRAGFLSNNADLSNLIVSDGTNRLNFTPQFSSNVTSYSMQVQNGITNANVTPIVSDTNKATVKVNGVAVISGSASGAIPLIVGDNTINIVVTAENGTTTKTYTVVINRAGLLSNNADLSKLVIYNGTNILNLSPTFSANTNNYSIQVQNLVDAVTIVPTVSDIGKASVKVNGVAVISGSASGTIPLIVGDNTINIVVTAENGTTTKTYNIIINRAGLLSNNADLSKLSIYNGTTVLNLSPSFLPSETNYSMQVQNTVANVNFTPTVSDTDKATVKVNGVTVTSGTASGLISLIVGDNSVNIVVIAENGTTTKTYTVVINRAGALSNNADLSKLTVYNGITPLNLSPSFSSSETNYSINVQNSIASTTFVPTVSDVGKATVKVNGVSVASGSASNLIPLVVGNNTINVEVTAENGISIKNYVVIINRSNPDLSNNADLSSLIVSDGTNSLSLSPPFSATEINYSIQVQHIVANAIFTPTVSDVGKATVKVNGVSVASGSASDPISLIVGDNTINIEVIAQNTTTTRTYVVTINRANPILSNNADLSSLSVTDGTNGLSLTPTFLSSVTSYTIQVQNSVINAVFTPTVSDTGKATVKVNDVNVISGSASGLIPLNTGDNTINIEVIAQDTTTKTYVVTINRAKNNNADLSALSVTDGTNALSLTPIFSSGVTSYSIQVQNSVVNANFTPTALDSGKASIKVNGVSVGSGTTSNLIPLNTGDNTVDILVTAENGITTKTYTVVINRLKSSNADLSALSVTDGTNALSLTPIFSSGVTGYSIQVQNSVVNANFIPIVSDTGKATVKVNGVSVNSGSPSGLIPLVLGDNTIDTVVTAEDGTTKTYTVVINRAKSGNADLSALSVTDGTNALSLTPIFSSGVISYSIQVQNSITNADFTPTVSDTGKATVKVNGVSVNSGSPSGLIPLVLGDNTIDTVVTAEDGTTKTYTVVINRAKSGNADLSALSVTDGTNALSLTPIFSSGVISYSIQVQNSITNADFTPTVSDTGKATVKVNGVSVNSGSPSGLIPLVLGDNTIDTVVTAEDGTTKTYTVVINRLKNDDANLHLTNGLILLDGTNDATVLDFSPVYSQSTETYSISVINSQYSVRVKPTVSDTGKAIVTVNSISLTSGTISQKINLNTGNNDINILVTAENGTTTKLYTITVNRAGTKSNDADLSNIVTSDGTMSPSFASNVLSYDDVVLDTLTSITITPTVSHIAATVTVDGTSVTSGSPSQSISLTSGTIKQVPIIVTAEDGTTKQYTVNISCPVLSVTLNSANLDFGEILKGETPKRTFKISNIGLGSFTWDATPNQSWINLTTTSGTVSTNTESIDVTINTSSLTNGQSYSGDITTTTSAGVKDSTKVLSLSLSVRDPAILTGRYAKFTGSGGAKVKWTGLPSYAKRIKLYYFTNDDNNNDFNISFNGTYNLSLAKSYNYLKTQIDPSASDASGTTYELTLNNGVSTREIYILKITWDGGEALAENGTLSGGATFIDKP